MNRFFMFLVVAGIPVLAQTGTEKVNVPLHDPSRPASVHVNTAFGSITLEGSDVKDVVVEARSGASEEVQQARSSVPQGMKRLTLPGGGSLDITEDNNVVTIKTGMHRPPVDLVITVPHRSSVQVKSMGPGGITVQQLDGEIDANSLNGTVTLKNVSGSVVAHSLNGTVLVTMDRVDPSKPMSFSTLNGDIDVTLPGNVKANVLMKTDRGDIFSEFDVKLSASARSATEHGRQPDGTYHLRLDRALHGTIDGGGPEYQFTTFNGQIYLRRKK